MQTTQLGDTAWDFHLLADAELDLVLGHFWCRALCRSASHRPHRCAWQGRIGLPTMRHGTLTTISEKVEVPTAYGQVWFATRK
jgi:hypothetical protein